MYFADLTANLVSPPILCFALGLLAAWVRSDLEFPAALTKGLSLFLLFALGFKGGLSLASSSFGGAVFVPLLAAVFAATLVPVWVFFALRGRLGTVDAAAVAATYGSVSAVTFITATAYLAHRDIPYSGHMVAAMALMESPAIIMGVLLARRFARTPDAKATVDWRHLGRDAFLNGSVFLLLGSLVVGLACGPERSASLTPFLETVFPGALALFLLDLGTIAGRRLSEFRGLAGAAGAFAFIAALVNAGLGLGLAALLGLDHGDAFLLVVLCASASYIAAPAALRVALPQANPGLYVTLSLALTFPFNLLVGLPLYDRAVAFVVRA